MRKIETLGLTKQRLAVLSVIREAHEHLTANEVFENSRKILPGISFATVYNSLRYLKDAGLIGEVRFGSEVTRFDRTLTRHDHAMCNKCGQLVDLDLPVPKGVMKKMADMSKYQPTSLEIVLRGICPDCSE